jgi:hypothetical protein
MWAQICVCVEKVHEAANMYMHKYVARMRPSISYVVDHVARVCRILCFRCFD